MPDAAGPAPPDPQAPPFAGFTGRGVNVGVIDSGVHAGHAHIGRVAGGVAITPRGAVEGGGETAYLDRLGHGTAVTAAIQEKAPDADVYAVKVFDDALRTTGVALLAAMDWCIVNGMDIVNLSLGSTNPAHEPAFGEAARRAEAAGVLLVAARSADGAACYPGSLPTVLGVDLDWDCPRDGYRRADGGYCASRCAPASSARPCPAGASTSSDLKFDHRPNFAIERRTEGQ
jgi:subtilisin family serine protease